MRREITLDDIKSLAVGAWILGTGGDGSPYLRMPNMRRLYAEGKVVDVAAVRPKGSCGAATSNNDRGREQAGADALLVIPDQSA